MLDAKRSMPVNMIMTRPMGNRNAPTVRIGRRRALGTRVLCCGRGGLRSWNEEALVKGEMSGWADEKTRVEKWREEILKTERPRRYGVEEELIEANMGFLCSCSVDKLYCLLWLKSSIFTI